MEDKAKESPTIGRLTEVRRRVVGLMIQDRHRDYFASDVARELNLPPASVGVVFKAMVGCGWLHKAQRGGVGGGSNGTKHTWNVGMINVAKKYCARYDLVRGVKV